MNGVCVQNIDEILAGRTQKRQLGSRAGNTFSTATFAAEEKPVCDVVYFSPSCPVYYLRFCVHHVSESAARQLIAVLLSMPLAKGLLQQLRRSKSLCAAANVCDHTKRPPVWVSHTPASLCLLLRTVSTTKGHASHAAHPVCALRQASRVGV